MSRSVAQNTTYLTASYILQKVISFFYFILIARSISVENVGTYTFAMSFTTLAAVFIDMGLSQILIRESAKYKDKAKEYLSATLSFRFIASLVVYLLVFLGIGLFLKHPLGNDSVANDLLTKQLVYLSGLVMIMDSFTLGFWGLFRGFQNLKYEAIGVVLNQLIVVAIGGASLFFKLPLHFLVIAFIGGSLFNLIFSAILVRRKLKIKLSFNWDKKLIFSLLKLSFPFALLAIFGRIYGYIDQILLYFLAGAKEIALYSSAYKMIFALQFIPSAFAAAIFPAMSSYFVEAKDKLKDIFDKSMAYLTMLAVPIMFGIASLADKIIGAAYTDDYLPAVITLQLLSIGVVFVFLNFPLGSLLNATDRQVQNTKLVGLTMIINLTLNIILIPILKYNGAAIAFLCSHGFLFFAGLYCARKVIAYSKRLLLISFAKTVLAGGIMSLVVMSIKDSVNILLSIAVGAIVYLAVMLAVKGIDKKDYNEFKKIFLR
ncbi:MAG TPA: flippase [Candidatus Bipolaricaulota bacterium]|nr:flippase [Candidatus Bipolaricaulota bacterium]